MQIISVVRDFDMYNRLVRNNPNSKDATFVAFDNNAENLFIAARYNSFLDSYDYADEDWFVFCHEDWEVFEDLKEKLTYLDKNFLYGPIGAKKDGIYNKNKIIGQIYESDKDGCNRHLNGEFVKDLIDVDTFDCQCLIIHSSLVKKHGLRFDENLSFDLYVEDFCINAKEKFGISSKILQLSCQHYSCGKITKRFYKQLSYLKSKYCNTFHIYASTAGSSLVGNRFLVLLYRLRHGFFNFLYKKKITKSGRLSVKICKIPMPVNFFRKHG